MAKEPGQGQTVSLRQSWDSCPGFSLQMCCLLCCQGGPVDTFHPSPGGPQSRTPVEKNRCFQSPGGLGPALPRGMNLGGPALHIRFALVKTGMMLEACLGRQPDTNPVPGASNPRAHGDLFLYLPEQCFPGPQKHAASGKSSWAPRRRGTIPWRGCGGGTLRSPGSLSL